MRPEPVSRDSFARMLLGLLKAEDAHLLSNAQRHFHKHLWAYLLLLLLLFTKCRGGPGVAELLNSWRRLQVMSGLSDWARALLQENAGAAFTCRRKCRNHAEAGCPGCNVQGAEKLVSTLVSVAPECFVRVNYGVFTCDRRTFWIQLNNKYIQHWDNDR